jgi:hypothetical protein
VSVSFEQNLAAILPEPHGRGLRKFVIDDSPRVRKEILRRLRRMNMTSATLFPGLDGFARSLNTLVAMPETIRAGRDVWKEIWGELRRR